MFQKVLVANRGEIAVRIIRACRDLGLTSVAVYSDADRSALHVRLADEAYRLGPAPAAESYLNATRLLEVARRCGAGAIHPGYGFLSENADFVESCIEAGIVFVGPSPDVQRAMGEKTAARRTAQAAGVPVVPGAMTGLEDSRNVAAIAQELGYPVMLKAAAGGGGKGIRLVSRPEDLQAALRQARSEAANAFGDSSVYLEKAISPARHIEVQILGDTHGTIIHLGERECSIQRRHQKLIEESPSVALTPELRAGLTGAAVALAGAIGYVNAGTVEFLFGPDGNYYFLEINTRLQVEHPVTEWCTGVDLAKEQLRIALGYPLSVTQADIVSRGHAIECRISAEDPGNRFLPATGVVSDLYEPSGPGVRVDSSLYTGLDIPLFYDPLLAKLITWGKDRAEAITRMQRALHEYQVGGVRTTLPFARFVLAHPDFLSGNFSTDFVAEHWTPQVAEAVVGADESGSAAPDLLGTVGAGPPPQPPAGESGSAVPDLLGADATQRPSEFVAAALAAALAEQEHARRRQLATASTGDQPPTSRWRDAGRREGLR